MSHRILLVEDEPNYRKVLAMMLADLDVQLLEAHDGVDALEKLAKHDVDLVVTDINMPRMNGLDLLARIREQGGPPVVVVTAYSSVESAVQAMQNGAIDYLQKPFDEERLKLTLRRALRMTDLLAENARLRDDMLKQFDFSSILGQSAALVHAMKTAAKIAASDGTVLVKGESGTGKELFARAIHNNGKRAKGPFVALNCAALPEHLLEAELFGAEVGAYTGATKRRRGRVELARGGSLFLDEIGDMPLVLQAKLLRLLQEKTFTPLGAEQELKADVRFVFATHRDLPAQVKAGLFREDLLFRVSVLQVELPPLRDRGDDVLLLADALCARACESMGRKPVTFTDAAKAALLRHAWPGNVRELGNVIERAVILMEGDALDKDDLELPVTAPPLASTSTSTTTTAGFRLPDEGIQLEVLERDLVKQALARTDNNKSQAARLLGLTRATLRYRIEKMGLE